jgi:Arc/MetJ family transcription regulator
MGRTNIVIDEEPVGRVMRPYGLPSKRAAVDFALRRAAAERSPHQAALELCGTGWDGDLDELRRDRPSRSSRGTHPSASNG